ncbi:MAG: leucine-rich repeat domain-containing protein, partial [Eubacterium sp.]
MKRREFEDGLTEKRDEEAETALEGKAAPGGLAQETREDTENPASAEQIYRLSYGISCVDAEYLQSHPQAQQAKKIILPETLEELGNYCFSGFQNLEEAVFPASVLKMGRGIFRHCWHLKRALLPSGTVYLDDQFFYGCGKLKELFIPASVEEI